MPVLSETNIYRAWASKQSAKGTPATTASRSFKQVAGGVLAAVDSGNENFSDGTAFGDITTWLNSVTGTGSPGIEGSSDELGWLLWMFHGAETVSIAGTNEINTLSITGTPTGGSVILSLDARNLSSLNFNATAGAVQAAVEALPAIGLGNVVGTGGPWPATPIVLTFGNAMQKRPIAPFTLVTNSLTGGATPSFTSVDSTPGLNAQHVTSASGSVGFWMTWWQTVGATTVQRLKMNDGRIGQIVIEASTGTKALRVTPNLLFVDPAEVYSTDPTPGMPTSPVMLYTEGQGAYTVDGQVFTGQTQFQLTLNLDLSFVYGDDVIPFDFARGNVGATIGATMLFDDTMLARWNTWIYGVAAPVATTKPLKRIPPIGSYSCNLQKKDTAANVYGSFAFSVPGIQWDLPDSPGPNPDQGSAEVGLTGRFQKLPGQSLYSITVGNQSAAYTV